MIRFYLLFLSVYISFTVTAQDTTVVAEEKKPTPKMKIIQLDLSAGLGLYSAYDNISHGSGTGINAAANLASVKASYSVNQLAFGLEAKAQRFLTEDDTNNLITRASGGSLIFHTDYHYSYKNKFNAWFGAGLGVCGFNYTRTYRDSLTRITGEVRATGPSLSLNTGLRWYFVKFMGIHLSASYALYPLRYESFTINGQEQETVSYRRVNETIVNIRGPEVKFGLSFRF